MNRLSRRAAIGAVLALAGLLATSAQADIVAGGGTVVVKQQGQGPAADNGTLACEPNSGVGIGGACLEFTPGGFVEVNDVVNGHNVAFQVCIDANGDGICTDDKSNPSVCPDLVFFSHDDNGIFHNPLGPLPTSMPCAPTTNGWNGYVVFLCEGAHVTGGSAGAPGGPPHTHETTIANVSNTGPLPDSGYGDFCGTAGRREPVRKPYTIIR